MQNNNLISRKALMDAVYKSLNNNPHSDPTHRAMHKHEHNHFLVMILRAHAVDAAPVVYGQMEEVEPCNITVDRQCCSCGTPMGSQDHYCPNCGAKMAERMIHNV